MDSKCSILNPVCRQHIHPVMQNGSMAAFSKPIAVSLHKYIAVASFAERVVFRKCRNCGYICAFLSCCCNRMQNIGGPPELLIATSMSVFFMHCCMGSIKTFSYPSSLPIAVSMDKSVNTRVVMLAFFMMSAEQWLAIDALAPLPTNTISPCSRHLIAISLHSAKAVERCADNLQWLGENCVRLFRWYRRAS